MKTIQEIFEAFQRVGVVSCATLDGKGSVESRMAVPCAYDAEGIYIGTMTVKPFYRQMKEGGCVSLCGEYPTTRVSLGERNKPYFEPGYTVRLSGQVREISEAELMEKASGNPLFDHAVDDLAQYPETRYFVIYKGHGEIYDYDYEMEKRDHKIERERFAFGGEEIVAPGLSITGDCTGCGACLERCSFKAIEEGTPYRILGNRCDECGDCYNACPVGAVVTKGL